MAKKAKSSGGKKPHKNNVSSKRWEKYTIENDAISKKKQCPRCGPGVFLAVHKDRFFCGKCHYAEFFEKKQKTQEQPEKEKIEEKKE
jgi:ubiquitin-small subunit ribosomal protein S27Ae